ncbi:zinc finger MYND domain-containing protein 12 [Mugil cephalus]|uniref:zinc finger MYND domain-containing protein 12 n=1 Tax=Mugil cephalus TaxID=48193 RepID=UPI001FB68CE0|nr:zinc finger MYND domain-containing protein 12 [Mugil cephalus]
MEPEFSETTSEIIPLSLPKGKEKLCELCQREARLQCRKCGVTYYCDAEHQHDDWVGIHEKICQLLVPIRTETPLSLQKAGRGEIQQMKAELIDVCREAAQSKLYEGKPREALPAARFCMRCSVEVHGANTIQLVPAYLLLAEANMGLGKLALVAELLSQAEWVVSKSPESSHAIRSQLHRSMGNLHVATGNLEAALFHFANDIYFATEAYGLDSIVTCTGYFLIADVFAKQGRMPVVRSLYSEVAQVWHRHLTKLFEAHVENAKNPGMLLESCYDEAHRVEVDKMLRAVLEFEQSDSRKNPAKIATVAHCLAMLWFLGGDPPKALGFGSTALQAGQLIPNQDLTEPIQRLLQLVQSQQTEPHPGSD